MIAGLGGFQNFNIQALMGGGIGATQFSPSMMQQMKQAQAAMAKMIESAVSMPLGQGMVSSGKGLEADPSLMMMMILGGIMPMPYNAPGPTDFAKSALAGQLGGVLGGGLGPLGDVNSLGGFGGLLPANDTGAFPLTGGKNNADFSHNPEIALALASIMKPKADDKGNVDSSISFKNAQKELKEKFGIESELTEVDGKTTLKFANGDFISDTNGNGVLEMKELGFKDQFAGMQVGAGLNPNQFNPAQFNPLGSDYNNPFSGDSFNIFGDYGDDKKGEVGKNAETNPLQQQQNQFMQRYMQMMMMFCMCQAYAR